MPSPPSGAAALAGATILANLSASNITIGKADTRTLLSQSQSARCQAAYLYAAAGVGESTTDLAWDGQVSIFENGVTLAESPRFPLGPILGFTMPGFATSDHTKTNAITLMEALGITWTELDIRPAATQMLGDMGHPFGRGEPVYDVTFENVQAGLRTDYLFRLANHNDAIVIGTGDLSELALGWCTYGVGDQMSHYNVNGGIPKTLIQHLIRWVISTGQFDAAVGATLTAILATEISPELVPAGEGEAPQSTEAKIGPYALQDFTLFHVLRYRFRPSKIAFLALMAWEDAARGEWPPGYPEDKRLAYDLPQIRHWMAVFLRRFFAFSQFKRSSGPPCRTARRSAEAAAFRPGATGARPRTAMRRPG